jgi:hypothetical protein
MNATARLLAGLATPVLALSLVACSADTPAIRSDDPGASVLGKGRARAALLTLEDLGPGYLRQTPDENGDNQGIDCLSTASRAFDRVQGETELEAEYRKTTAAATLGEVSVLSGFSSFSQTDTIATALDELQSALRDCSSAEYEEGEGTVRFDISVSDDKAVAALDQQVNLSLDGDITVGTTAFPLEIQLRYFRIANHSGTVSVSLLNAPDQVSEIDRVVGIAIDRFVEVARPGT